MYLQINVICRFKGDLIVSSGTSSFEGVVTANNGATLSGGNLLISQGDLTLTTG